MQEKEVHPATEKGFNSIPEEPRTRKVGQLHPVERPDPQPREKGHSYTQKLCQAQSFIVAWITNKHFLFDVKIYAPNFF